MTKAKANSLKTLRESLKERKSKVREVSTKLDIQIPNMPMWEQIEGDMDPGAHGGTIAKSDGNALELLKIQPVREYVGDGEAAEVGFPFWTREAYFDLDDLNPDNKDVKSALAMIGMEDQLEELTPTQRALTIASALLDYGRADEGPAGWSSDIIHDNVKWHTGTIAGAEYLADEDEEFRREILGEEDEEEDEEVVEEARRSRGGPRPGDESRRYLASYIAHAVMYTPGGLKPIDLVRAYHLTNEEATRVLADQYAYFSPGGKNYAAFVEHVYKVLRDKEWFSAPEPKEIPGAALAYGRYAWLLENEEPPNTDQGRKDHSDIEDLERQLNNVGFNGWGLFVDNWPEALEYYNAAPSVYRSRGRNRNEEPRRRSMPTRRRR